MHISRVLSIKKYGIGIIMVWGFIGTLIPVFAVEIPATSSVAYIQTSGPNAGLNIGDYYTNVNGDPNPANRFHEFEIYVPCAWTPAVPITFALYDPETLEPNPVSPSAEDEVRGAADDTSFTLTAPGGAVIGPVIYTPVGGTNGLWVELSTITIGTPGYGCGTYTLRTTTSNDDDNAWRLRVANDPDCSPSPGTCSGTGAAQSAMLGNVNGRDDVDGIAGTGDELLIGANRTTYQHAANFCQSFFFFVDGRDPIIYLHNFDLDDPGGGNPAVSVTHFPPASSVYAPSVSGTESGQSAWNVNPDNPGNNANPPRNGDAFNISANDIGWWRTEVCVPPDNQYVFEGEQDTATFDVLPPVPQMSVAKDDGLTLVSYAGQVVTYVITYRNTGTGAAINTMLEDNLPPGATFVGCTGGCTGGGAGPIFWDLGVVPAGATGNVTLTVRLPAALAGTQHINTVTLSYTDTIGLVYPDEEDTDIDTVVGSPPVPTAAPTWTLFPTQTPPPPTVENPPPGVIASITPTFSAESIALQATLVAANNVQLENPLIRFFDPFITKSVNPPFSLPGEPVTWTIVITNPGTLPFTGVQMTDVLPAEVEITGTSTTSGNVTINGQRIIFTQPSLAAGGSITIKVNARVHPGVAIPYVITNNACLIFAEAATTDCDDASVISVTNLPNTGESILSDLRPIVIVLVGLIGAGVLMMGMRVRRLKS